MLQTARLALFDRVSEEPADCTQLRPWAGRTRAASEDEGTF
jgi:hypothetical protein